MAYYHVRVSIDGERHDEVKTDVPDDVLESQFLSPYRAARPITINGRSIPSASIKRIRISTSEVPIRDIIERVKVEERSSNAILLGGPSYAWRAASKANDVTDQFITGPPGMASMPLSITEPAELDSSASEPAIPPPNSVFIVTGRDSDATTALVATIRSFGIQIVEWEQAVAKTGLPSPYVGEVVATGLRMATAAVVVMTPDDLVTLREDLVRDDDAVDEREIRGQARPNVFYEAGFADAIGRDRTVIVEIGNPKSFTDAAGRHVIRYDGSPAKRNTLAERLRLAGLEVDTSGTDWLTVGDLTPALDAATTALADARVSTNPTTADTAIVVEQLEAVLATYDNLRARSALSDLSDLPSESLDLLMRAQALVDGYSTSPTYIAEVSKAATQPTHIRIPILIAAVRAMHEDITP
jgi:predicted nucleotide-binding protein